MIFIISYYFILNRKSSGKGDKAGKKDGDGIDLDDLDFFDVENIPSTKINYKHFLFIFINHSFRKHRP